MRVAVVGPGALGCLFASQLSRSGAEVVLIDHREDRAERLGRSGVRYEGPAGEFVAKPGVSTVIPRDAGLAIVLVKSYSTPSVYPPADVPVLTLQNGLGNAEVLCSKVSGANLLVGSTREAATLAGEGHVRHISQGLTVFGAWTTCESGAASDALSKAGFTIETTTAPGQIIWEKVAINAGINPLTALLNVTNGRLIESLEVRQLMRDLVVEAAKVAAMEGYRFPHSLVEMAEEICEQTAGNISSMLQDVRAGRRTEIDAISGELLRRGQAAGLPMPRTRAIWQLMKGMEQFETPRVRLFQSS